MENTNKKALVNLIWRFAERCGAQGVSFVVSMILARLLEPELYGTLALVTVFINILQVFVNSGMGSALIQKKNADNVDFSTVFFFNLATSIVLYLVMFVAAPGIAIFYKDPELTPIVRVLSLSLIVSGLKNVQQAYVSRQLQFRRFFFATLGGTVLAAIVGVIMAYKGCGVWALVTQFLLNSFIDTFILWITVKWRPQFVFSLKSLKELLAFGWKLLASSLLDTFYINLRQLIIGKIYLKEDLAFYNKGEHLPSLIIMNINSSIDSVLLPVMSREQDDIVRIKEMTRRSIKLSTFIIGPLMVGMFCVATPMIRLLLTEKWLPCVPYLRIFCIIYLLYPIHTTNLNAIKALGRSDLFFKLEIIKKAVGLIMLLSTVWFGVLIMAYSLILSSILSQIINSWPNKKLLNYGYLEQLKDIFPGILLAVFMGICIWPISLLHLPDIITLTIQVVSGAIIYVSFSIIFKIDSFQYLWGIIRPYLKRTKKSEK